MTYNFYYDESEHSRKINYATVVGETYYDNFLTAIIGWDTKKESAIESKYTKFEEKYAERKKNGELKSDTFKSNQFIYGFASFNKPNIEMLKDFLSIIDDDFHIYFSNQSKIEFVVLQLLKNYHSNFFVDMDKMKYSIVKAILTYRPKDVIECIYHKPEEIVDSLITFFTKRIEINKTNMKLKERENEAFNDILSILNDVEPPITLEWDYHMPFAGFDKYLNSKGIHNYSLTLDKEGKQDESSKTLVAAKEIGLSNVNELDSKQSLGLRIADLLVGIIGKTMKSLFHSLHTEANNESVTKTLLDKKWFSINEEQLYLYKRLYHIVFEINDDYYKIYSGNYSDDLVSFLGLLSFMNHFDNIDQIKQDIDMQPEYCNGCMGYMLNEHFKKMSNKLPIEPIIPESKEYFRNSRGAKVYFDITKQPILTLNEGSNRFYILSVGNSMDGCPLATIAGDKENICYRLPPQLSDWAVTVTGMAMLGERLFPAEVIITKANNNFRAEIL